MGNVNDTQPVKKEEEKENVFESKQYATKINLIDCGNYNLVPSNLNPMNNNVIKVLCISDTHNLHKELSDLPSADILIHSGDFTTIGREDNIKAYDEWIYQLVNIEKKFKFAILIAGNHDITLDEEYYHSHGYKMYSQRQNTKACKGIIENGNSIYLENNSVNLFGLSFYGSPIHPNFCNWAFQRKRGESINKEWMKIPENTVDVLITHGPPMFHGDLTIEEETHCGCRDLLERVKQLKNIKFHVFGHVHEGYGCSLHDSLDTIFLNASVVNEDYEVVNKPIMFYIESKLPNNADVDKENECFVLFGCRIDMDALRIVT